MMSKFENMDVIAFLGTIMNQNTGFISRILKLTRKRLRKLL